MPKPLAWSRFDEAYRAIFEKLPFDVRSEVGDCNRMDFSYDANGNLSTLVFKLGAATLLTLTFAYDANQNLTSVTRS